MQAQRKCIIQKTIQKTIRLKRYYLGADSAAFYRSVLCHLPLPEQMYKTDCRSKVRHDILVYIQIWSPHNTRVRPKKKAT
jgi:hypothetical protein